MAAKKTDKEDESNKPDDSKSTPQVHDVAKPGLTAATPTSRPIITPHSGMIKQDPMVSGGSTDKLVDEESESRISAKPELKIKPIDGDKPDEDEVRDEPAPETEKEKKDDKPEPDADKPETKGEEEKPAEENAGEAQGDDSAAIDSLASSASNKQTAQETEEEKKHNEKIKELADSKEYHVPIVEGGHKASYERLISWLILILLLAAVGLYLAIDAGLLNIGIKLPYNFIGN